MSYAEKHIIETYAMLFDGLSSISKIELIESLTKSLKKDKIKNTDSFYNSFGAFSSEKTAKEIITEIKNNRKFVNKEISF